jgi:hypothetical protein
MAICGGGGGSFQYWGTYNSSYDSKFSVGIGGNAKSNGITYYSGGHGGICDFQSNSPALKYSTSAVSYGGGGGGLGCGANSCILNTGFGYSGVVIVTSYTKLTHFIPSSVSGIQMWLTCYNYTDFSFNSTRTSINDPSIKIWYDKNNTYNGTTTSTNTAGYRRYYYNAVYFTNNGYFTTTLSSTLTSETSFIVFRITQSCNAQLFGTVSVGGRYIVATTSNNIQLGGSSSVTFSDLTFNYTNIYILIYDNNNGTQRMYLNGTKSSTSGAQTFSGTNNYTCIGASMYGYIYEIITYNTSLSVSDKNSIQSYLANAYNVTVNTIT